MASNEQPRKERKQNDVLEFISELGDFSPVDGLRGPKTPSRRQVLRLFLFFIALGNTLAEAADKVVPEILKKHPKVSPKSYYKLRDDIISLYHAIRCEIGKNKFIFFRAGAVILKNYSKHKKN